MNYSDILAHLGEGAAHPGGFGGTARLLERYPLHPKSRVLEIGCGTGRTACHLAKLGCEVTGLDLNRKMLAKASSRAKREAVEVQWVHGDAACLPFEDHSFDYLFIESVTIFVQPEQAIQEYYRVLKPGGRLLDREWFSRRKNHLLEQKMNDLYNVRVLPLLGEWVQYFENNHFAPISIWAGEDTHSTFSSSLFQSTYADYNQMIDVEALNDERVIRFLERNHTFIREHERELNYAVFIADKPK
ncbi:class I SAM-dependent methyltransferase [Paenibacillus sp. CAA11]|uniref:class I SAM-dependent methyltransferase n=1 Tax=Paenibacillus sp. CAA11 TaxID=1532905 RepID=UPI00131F10D3|nr:methyltransferase domain-containing protein [Paenibacillus sp. CAA11]